MKCPGCDSDVEALVDKPIDNSITWSDAGGSVIAGTTGMMPSPTQQTFKCCNKDCWVTRIEVDWNHG